MSVPIPVMDSHSWPTISPLTPTRISEIVIYILLLFVLEHFFNMKVLSILNVFKLLLYFCFSVFFVVLSIDHLSFF